MNGKDVNSILAKNGYSQKEIAELLGISQQLLSKKLNVQDIKTTFLEQLCDVLNVDMSYFYKGTQYLPTDMPASTGGNLTELHKIIAQLSSSVERLTKEIASQQHTIELLSNTQRGDIAPTSGAPLSAAK